MEEEPSPQPDSIHPRPAMESRDENPQRVSPQFEEVDIRRSIRSADEPITEEFDRSNDEGSIPVPPKLDDGGERQSSTAEEEEVNIVEENPMAVEEDEPQVYERDERVSSLKEEEGNVETAVAMEKEKAPVVEPSADEAMEENTEEKSPDRERSLLAVGDEKEEEAATEEEGKDPITEPSVDEIRQENAEEKPLDVSEPTSDKELNGERSLLADGDEKISSLIEEEEKRKPLVSVADIDEVMRDNVDDAHEVCSTEELNRERPQLVEGDSKFYSLQETLAEKDDKVSLLEQALLGKEGEDKVDVPDDIRQEEDEDKPIEFDGIHPSEQLDEEIPQSGEDVAKPSSLQAEFVGEKEREPISELSVSTAAVDEIKHEKVEQEFSEEQLKEETVASAGKTTEVPSLQQEQIDEDNKISALPEDSAEKDEKVSSLKEESAEKSQEESAEKEEDDEVDTAEGGPAKAAGRRTGSKQKRGRPQVANGRRTRAPSKPKEDEELCFICFDGGDLVVCDHRGCPKVYHPSCVNRDEEYFKAKGQWTCGWHICSSCQKSARYMCYTCTYSLCRGCIKESDFVCVRGNKGFCKECMKTVMLIEMNKHADDTMGVIDFDDKTSWMYLFKDYWVDLKEKLSLTTEELIEARNPLKETNTIFGNEKHLNRKRAAKWNEEPLENSGNASDDQGGSASSSSKRYKENASLRKKVKKRSRNTTNRGDQVKGAGTGQISNSEDIEWASKELLEFVEHMKDGDRSVLSQFDVQALLLEYIKQNNLRDPRRKSQIICDSRLWALFGKSRVGHLEMLKLLEPHFLIKEASPIVTDDNQGGVVDPEPSQTDADGNSDASTKISDLRRKSRRRVEEKGLMNPDDYAAIDVHNVSLMYLRRNLMEEFLDDVDAFNDNVVGSFVRIRISGSTSAKDMYRLVQVVGTGKAAGKYKTGKKTTDITLEILNLNKREVITIDLISNQEFTEEECERLRQSVKCGFIDRPKVAEVQEKARALHTVRVDDWLESEKARLGHLRDRASEKGRKKEHRECVEKLQLLSTPEERIRRLNVVPEIHVDPNMDPDYDSTEDEEGQDAKREDNKKQKPYFKGGDEFSTGREGFSAHKNSLAAWDSNRNISKAGVQGIVLPTVQADRTYGFSRNQGNDAHSVSSPRTPKNEPNATDMDAVLLKIAQPVAEPGQARGVAFETVPQQANIVSSSTSENEKMWHYQDPAGKIQGPFSMTQLRKWNASKFFPANLRIWRTSEKQEDSILLTDALSGKLHKDSHQQEPQLSNTTQHTNATAMLGSRANNMDGAVRENTILQAAASSPATDNYNLVNSDKWTTHPSSLSVTNTGVASNHMDGRPAASSTGWESSKISNAWPDQSQACNAPRPINPSSRNLSHQTSFHGRDGRGENNGRWNRDRSWQNNWNSNRHRRFQPNDRAYERQHPYQSSSRQQYRGEQWKGQPANDSSNQLGNGSFNPPANAPQPSNIDWASLQGALNRISASVQPACSGLGSDLQQSPANVTSLTLNSVGGWASNAIPYVNLAETPENIGVLSDFQQQNKLTESAIATSASHAVYCGSNATESMDRSNRRQGLESSSSNTKPHSEQASVDVLNSESIQPANPQNDTGDHTVPMNELDANMKCPGAHDRSNPENKPVNNTVVGPASVAPNALGSSNLSDASVAVEKLEASSSSAPSSAHQQGPNSLSTNAAQPVNIGWGMAQQNPNAGTGTGQETGHLVHTAIPGAANIGWGMVTPGLVNMGWGPPAQPTMGWGPPAQPNMNPNLGWAIPTQGNVNANLAWGAQAMANPNAGWGMPMQVNPAAVNPGWFAPVIGGASPSPSWVAPTEGNTNQNAAWGTPVQGTGHGSMNGGASNQNGGGEGEQRGICNFHRHGYCKKGASCNYIHS